MEAKRMSVPSASCNTSFSSVKGMASSASHLENTSPDKTFTLTDLNCLTNLGCSHNQQCAITRLRSIMFSTDSSYSLEFRLTVAIRLADLLLRSNAMDPFYTSAIDDYNRAKISGANDLVCPSDQQELFTPVNVHEEAILSLMIAEAIATFNYNLNESASEHKVTRQIARDKIASVFDLLALYLVRFDQVRLFLDILSHGGMKCFFQDSHAWMQRALAQTSVGEYNKAVQLLSEHFYLFPLPSTCLLAAKIVLLHQNDAMLAIDWCSRANTLADISSSPLCARVNLIHGVAFYKAALVNRDGRGKALCIRNAHRQVTSALHLDPLDHLSYYYMARLQAHCHCITEALVTLKQAINLHAEHLPSLILLALLFTAHKNYEDAYQLLNASLVEWPQSMELFWLKAILEEHLFDEYKSLETVTEMLKVWKDLFEDEGVESNNNEILEDFPQDFQGDVPESWPLCESSSSALQSSLTYTLNDNHELKCSAKPHEVMHNNTSPITNAGSNESNVKSDSSSVSFVACEKERASEWLARIWQLLSEYLLKTGDLPAAVACEEEARQVVSYVTPEILILRGKINVELGRLGDAKNCYESAISVAPEHTTALVELAKIYLEQNSPLLAREMLHQAIATQGVAYEAWYLLAHVAHLLGDYQESVKYSEKAIEIEALSPIFPFDMLPITFDG